MSNTGTGCSGPAADEKGGLKWHAFPLLAPYPELRHGWFTRHGGVSGAGGYELNLAFSEQDRPENVMTNIGRAAEALNLPLPAFVRQTHSRAVTAVRPEDGYQPRRPEDVRYGYDAMVAPRPGVSLLIKVADCQAVLLYDPQTRILGLVHSGWRGSVQNILAEAVGQMASLGAAPRRLLAAVAPSLGPCCAEFKNYGRELPPEFLPFRVSEFHFDFWAITRAQLVKAGLDPERIATAGICTKCAPEYFSYRRGDIWGRFGLMAAVIE